MPVVDAATVLDLAAMLESEADTSDYVATHRFSDPYAWPDDSYRMGVCAAKRALAGRLRTHVQRHARQAAG